MIKRTFCALSIIIISFGAFANEQLDRMETFGEEISKLMYHAMIESVEAEGVDVSKLKTLIPDTSWDEEMRGATACVLSAYEEKIGSDGIDDMLDEMESTLPSLRDGGMEAFEQLGAMTPSEITIEESIEINRSCGMTELQQKNMNANGFTTELMKLMAGQQ